MTDTTNTEIAVVPEGAVATSDSGSILTRLLELASTPGLNPEMFDRLAAMQERERDRQAEEAFNAAMNLCQAEIMPVVRRTENSQTRSMYAKLEHVDAAIRPIYVKYGFSVSSNTIPPLTPGNIRVEVSVSLGRHTKLYHREAPADTMGPQGKAVKTVLHGGGSTETYLKRYALCGAFNVVFANMDDDGVRGGQKFIDGAAVQELADLCVEARQQESVILQRMFQNVDGGGTIHSFEELENGAPYLAVKNMLLGFIAQNKKREAPNA
jgi:hypothetical protein